MAVLKNQVEFSVLMHILHFFDRINELLNVESMHEKTSPDFACSQQNVLPGVI